MQLCFGLAQAVPMLLFKVFLLVVYSLLFDVTVCVGFNSSQTHRVPFNYVFVFSNVQSFWFPIP